MNWHLTSSGYLQSELQNMVIKNKLSGHDIITDAILLHYSITAKMFAGKLPSGYRQKN